MAGIATDALSLRYALRGCVRCPGSFAFPAEISGCAHSDVPRSARGPRRTLRALGHGRHPQDWPAPTVGPSRRTARPAWPMAGSVRERLWGHDGERRWPHPRGWPTARNLGTRREKQSWPRDPRSAGRSSGVQACAARGAAARCAGLHGITESGRLRARVRTLGHLEPDLGGAGVSGVYILLKWVHIVSSTVLFGMGAGIAFFFIRAQKTGDVRVIAAVGREVVIADAIFTASAVVLQPLTGLAMVRLAGYPLSLPWLRWSTALYVLIGCCWLPVLWLQVRMRNLAARALQDGTALPATYFRYYRWWFYLGWPAFI